MKIYLIDHNQVLSDIKKEFEITDNIEEADRVVLWTDVIPFLQSVIGLARFLKIPVITIQHGRKGTSRYYPPFSMPIISDKLCVWGEKDKERLVEAGQDESKIEVTGTTIFSHLRGRKPHEGTNIIFSPEHWDREIEENRKTAEELRKMKGVRIITKIIEGNNPKIYDNAVYSNRADETHLDVCCEVLSTADLLVSVGEGTFELLAQALDIPVVIMDEWQPKPFGGDDRYLNYWRFISRAAKRTSLKNLIPTIEQQLKNPDELKKERREVVIEEGGINIKNPLEKIKKAIEEI